MTHARLFLVMVVCLAACREPTQSVACPAVMRRAIEVEVTDALTGRPIAAGAKGIVRDGAYADSLRVVGWRGIPPNDTATTLGAGDGRRGAYAVRVERPGYQPWEQQGVTPQVGACGVETARLRAALTPAS